MRTKLTALICLLSFACQAQKNFKKGYVVTNASDTVRGYINYVEQEKNPTSVTFKKNLQDASSQEYSIKDVQYFEIEGYEYFSRWLCNISMDQVDINRLSTEADTSRRIDTVFLRGVASGKNLHLYSYEDKLKRRFYIKSVNEDVPQELIYRVHLDDKTGFLRESKIYQNQLIRYAISHNVPFNKIEAVAKRSHFIKRDLIKVVEIINGENDQRFENANNYKRSRFFIQGGLGRATLKLTGSDHVEVLKFSESYFPVVGAGLDFFANPSIGRLVLRQELSFFMNKFNGIEGDEAKGDNFHYDLKRNTFAASSSVLYHIYNKESFKVFLGGGLIFNLSTYPENKYYREASETATARVKQTFKFNAFSIDGTGRAGMVFNNRIEASVALNVSVKRLTDYLAFADKHRLQQIRIGYLFSHQKR